MPDLPQSRRNLHGYGAHPPHPQWPGDARVAVSFVLNFEEGAEMSIAEGDPRNEGVYEVIDPLEGIADPCISSHFDYGTRTAWWRIMAVFERFNTLCTVSACGQAVDRSPHLARNAVDRGHEVAGHGWRWLSHARMSFDEERESILRTTRAIESAIGQRPVGWHTRSASSPRTRGLLMDAGYLYDSDFYGDDLPMLIAHPQGEHVVLPYAFDTNDMQFQHTQRFVRAQDFSGYVNDAFDWLWREGEHAPKMMTVALHLRMMRPARLWALEQILQHMQARGSVWIARRDQIALHWLARFASQST